MVVYKSLSRRGVRARRPAEGGGRGAEARRDAETTGQEGQGRPLRLHIYIYI